MRKVLVFVIFLSMIGLSQAAWIGGWNGSADADNAIYCTTDSSAASDGTSTTGTNAYSIDLTTGKTFEIKFWDNNNPIVNDTDFEFWFTSNKNTWYQKTFTLTTTADGNNTKIQFTITSSDLPDGISYYYLRVRNNGGTWYYTYPGVGSTASTIAPSQWSVCYKFNTTNGSSSDVSDWQNYIENINK